VQNGTETVGGRAGWQKENFEKTTKKTKLKFPQPPNIRNMELAYDMAATLGCGCNKKKTAQSATTSAVRQKKASATYHGSEGQKFRRHILAGKVNKRTQVADCITVIRRTEDRNTSSAVAHFVSLRLNLMTANDVINVVGGTKIGRHIWSKLERHSCSGHEVTTLCS
jgi:hypothetical protein